MRRRLAAALHRLAKRLDPAWAAHLQDDRSFAREYPDLQAAIVAVVNGELGGRIGREFRTPPPGSAGRY